MTMNQSDKKYKVRDYRELPFAYQDKPALRYMRQQWLDKHIGVDAFRNLRNVYCALTEIASNKASQTVEASNKTLLIYSGLKDWRTIKKCLAKLEEWSFIAITKTRGEDAKFKPRSITLLSVLHLTQNGNQSAYKTGRHGKQTASDGDDIEVKGLKEIKENYKEVNGRSEKLKSIAEARAELLRKMSIK
ncbi:MAG TPA: hypothetical protein VJB70_02340 [Candidatus Paceibacterota bacterium]